MKRLLLCLLISVCFLKCSEKKESIHFVSLKESEFNGTPFKLPVSPMFDSAKQAHENCMGFSFDANALLLAKKDSLFIGSIVNRQSLKTLSTLNDLGVTPDQIASKFSLVVNPCYEERVLHFPIKSIFGENFNLRFSGGQEEINKEINDALLASKDVNLKVGSWLYLDMTDALNRMLDTAKDPKFLEYRKNLLDTANITLTAVESVMNIILTVHTEKVISEPLKTLLTTKPYVLPSNSKFPVQLSYINSNTFQVFIEGLFPIVGQFTKAQYK